MEELEEGQIILCTVNKIAGTSVFVKTEDGREGTIVTSEIAPGRIRNLRDYVIPGKKIACKILNIRGNNINLSLRRVKQNERKELLDKIQKEQNYKAIIKTVIGKEEAEKLAGKISESENLTDFFEKVKQNSKLLERHFQKQDAEKILKILESKKEKPKEVKEIIKLSNNSSEGIKIVKEIIKTSCKDSKCDVSYLAAGKYSLVIRGADFKQIKSDINKVTQQIEHQAKKQNCEFSIEKN